MTTYVYLSTGKSRDVSRNAPDGARVAIHYPNLKRSVELTTDANGHWRVLDMPAPVYGGEVHEMARGQVGADPFAESIRTIRRELIALDDRTDIGNALAETVDAWDRFEYAAGTVEGGEREVMS